MHRMIIYQKVERDRGVIGTVALRSITVTDKFTGISQKTGQPIRSEFERLAHDLEPGIRDLVFDILPA